MVDEAAAYAALELSPGAGWDEIERAYKRLIGTHHPDRSGGDQDRAAQINQAFHELRSLRDRKDALDFAHPEPEFKVGKYRWVWAVPGFLLLAGVLVFASNNTSSLLLNPKGDPIGGSKASAMDGPLSASAISKSVNDARHLASTSDEMAIALASRDCQHLLRTNPSIEQFDRCAAFDDAVIQLQDRDPLRDQGPFSEIAVTSRQMSAASTLSNDSLAMDGRLDRIRLQVELALAAAAEAN